MVTSKCLRPDLCLRSGLKMSFPSTLHFGFLLPWPSSSSWSLTPSLGNVTPWKCPSELSPLYQKTNGISVARRKSTRLPDNDNNNNILHLYSIYYVPETVLSALQELSHLILITALGGRDYYYAHFTAEEAEEERVICPKLHSWCVKPNLCSGLPNSRPSSLSTVPPSCCWIK